ncbi:winged helix-turn-helix domain-containing protein [Halalkalicoccus subterraneus]|uniref:winged helix-turn-helix domain-containing protein n=1 Tax=Halalkalicoccus subterraneus TaxID=2675002 RepID=UPI000EFAA040|nr:winged helix-turn-helix domain-containing protein [Halalkalicoccus subterraneus]
MERKRDDSGKFIPQVTDERVLDALGGDTLSAQQVADKLGCSRQAADRRLRNLLEDGTVEKHTFGPRSVAWSLTDELQDVVCEGESDDG